MPPPFTDDPILQKYRFCNVYREDDRTTRWCKKYVRDPLLDKPEVLLAVVIFRWFNRITTGEAIFCQTGLTHNGLETAFEHYLRVGKTNVLLHAIKHFCKDGPYVTGAYTILGFRGMTKLHGVLKAIETFDCHSAPDNWRSIAKTCLKQLTSLEEVWDWLKDFPYLGGFTAAQIIADLKYTYLLSNAPDWYTFAKSGPGSRRGLNLVYGRPMKQPWRSETEWCEHLIKLRKETRQWFLNAGMVAPHAQDVQNICCEFSKYEKTRLGEGRPRGIFAA
jgi:hypothetical protein